MCSCFSSEIPHCILSAVQESTDLKQLVEGSNALEGVETQSGTSPGGEEGSQSPAAADTGMTV